MDKEQARAMFQYECRVGSMEHYGEKPAVAVIMEIGQAAANALAAWDRLMPLFPVDERIEDAEFEEFLRLRSILKRGLSA